MRRIVLVMVLVSGCSFVFVSGPPAQHEQLPYFSCSESRVVPVLDTIFAVLQGANFIFASSVSDERWAENFNGDPPISRTSSIPLYAVATLLGVGGAYYGFSRTAACRDARAQAMSRATRNGQPQTWPPPGAYAPPPPPQGPYAPPGQGPYAPPQGPGGPPGTPYPPTTTPYPPAPPQAAPQPPPAAPPPPPAPPPNN